MPNKFWGESVLCATYLINRMPLQSIDNQTPYFRLYKESANLDHLKIFGCLVYFSTSRVNRSKFDSRAAIGMFVGYSNTQKGYKVYDLKSNSIVFTRDIVFQENIFPYKIISSKNCSISQFLDDILFLLLLLKILQILLFPLKLLFLLLRGTWYFLIHFFTFFW